MNGEQLMRGVVAAFAMSDLRPLLNALHDDVVWRSASRHQGPFSFGGNYESRAKVIEVLSNISKDFTFLHMNPREIVSSDDIVWGLFDVGLRYDAKGEAVDAATIDLEMAIRWRIKDSKIIEHQAFFDTAHLLMRQGRVDV
jgi:ketosteroid isomerase-like protein